ncbi:hypothetical protein CC78DRAFT_538282 [Lojkania enalia]|uniref:Cytochrome b561 domain-containing protein n=1 Tax=Lojkania enalia TaxID=147567 RepID=A0A9P4JVM1_9PLEO|nr:hypothetical protein CC78DRAFT_538282 [Didymosphaeria enalia]
MASATGIPENAINEREGEDEPLLGHRGDASQMEGQNIVLNLWIGTAPLAQAGIWILAAIVWGSIFTHQLIFFSSHPLLNSAGLLLVTQSQLILQPTHTPRQKRMGTIIHSTLNLLATLSLTAGFIVIEINKRPPGHDHFVSPHAFLGLIFYILIYLQAIVGFTMYLVPQLYGGIEKAKSVWKYHRLSGYVVSLIGLATVCAATWTDYSLGFLYIQHWAVIVASVLVIMGVWPRIRLAKFGIKKDEGETLAG